MRHEFEIKIIYTCTCTCRSRCRSRYRCPLPLPFSFKPKLGFCIWEREKEHCPAERGATFIIKVQPQLSGNAALPGQSCNHSGTVCVGRGVCKGGDNSYNCYTTYYVDCVLFFVWFILSIFMFYFFFGLLLFCSFIISTSCFAFGSREKRRVEPESSWKLRFGCT